MKAPKPQPQEPRPIKVVAVQSLTPEFSLWNSATGTLSKVYGGNLCENSVYIDGVMPKIFRLASEEGNYEVEYLPEPLPDYIEEVILSENPECKLVITNADTMQISAPEARQKAECKIIETPYAKAVRLQNEAKERAKQAAKAREQGCIPLQLEFDYQPSRLQA